MKVRNPFVVLLLIFITFGIYGIYWMVVTKNELNAKGAEIPTAWLIIVPLVNYWWFWKYAEGTEKTGQASFDGILTFILLIFLGGIAQAILQNEYNNKQVTAAPAA